MRAYTTRAHGEERSAFATVPTAELYLLDENFRVLGARTVQGKRVTGVDFFELYPTNRVARNEVLAYVRSFPQKLLLQRCGKVPVLFVGSFFAYTGQIVAILPQGDVRRTLLYPAAFHQVLKGIEVAPFATAYYAHEEEKSFADACRFLVDLSVPFTFLGDCAIATLMLRAERMAARCEVELACDLSGLCALENSAVLDFATGVLFTAMMAIRRIGADGRLRVRGVSEGDPVLYLEFERKDPTDGMPEFEALLRRSEARGDVLDAVYDCRDPRFVQLRMLLCTKELSAQGVRERHRFLEGKSPLFLRSHMRPIPLPFEEISFD